MEVCLELAVLTRIIGLNRVDTVEGETGTNRGYTGMGTVEYGGWVRCCWGKIDVEGKTMF